MITPVIYLPSHINCIQLVLKNNRIYVTIYVSRLAIE